MAHLPINVTCLKHMKIQSITPGHAIPHLKAKNFQKPHRASTTEGNPKHPSFKASSLHQSLTNNTQTFAFVSGAELTVCVNFQRATSKNIQIYLCSCGWKYTWVSSRASERALLIIKPLWVDDDGYVQCESVLWLHKLSELNGHHNLKSCKRQIADALVI